MDVLLFANEQIISYGKLTFTVIAIHDILKKIEKINNCHFINQITLTTMNSYTMLSEINKKIGRHNMTPIQIKEDLVVDVYDILFNNKKFKEHESPEIYYYMALGLHFRRKYDKMVKYLLKAIDEGYAPAMCMLAHYYKKMGPNSLVLNFYLMAFNAGYERASGYLGLYYGYIGDLNNMIKYYKLGAKNKHTLAIRLLGDYYKKIGNIKKMIKYYLLGFDLGDPHSANALGYYYYYENDWINAKKYWDKACQLGSNLCFLSNYYYSIGNREDELACLLSAYENGIFFSFYYLALYYERLDNKDSKIKYLNEGSKYGCINCCNRLLEIYPDKRIKYQLRALNGGIISAKSELLGSIKQMNIKQIDRFLEIIYADFKSEFIEILNNIMHIQFVGPTAIQYFGFLTKKNMMVALKYIKKICNIFQPSECPVCYCERPLIRLKCKHSFCYKCLYNFLEIHTMLCPLCRGEIRF